jgi:hypothetical protein
VANKSIPTYYHKNTIQNMLLCIFFFVAMTQNYYAIELKFQTRLFPSLRNGPGNYHKFGIATSLSGDAKYALVAGHPGRSPRGAFNKVGKVIKSNNICWVFYRTTSNKWHSQGILPPPLNASPPYIDDEAALGLSLNYDGSVALLGDWTYNSRVGGAWVYVRIDNIWTLETTLNAPLIGKSKFGTTVALSGNGNHAIIGAPQDDDATGALWIFNKDQNGIWNIQGVKLIPSDLGGPNSGFGFSLSLSSNGLHLIAASYQQRKIWFFSRYNSNTTYWNQLGDGQIPSKIYKPAWFSVACSGDGNHAIVGSYNDDYYSPGALWFFTRNNSIWTENGGIRGKEAKTNSDGITVAINYDGTRSYFGGGALGATFWEYTRNITSNYWNLNSERLDFFNPEGHPTVSLSDTGSYALFGNTDKYNKNKGGYVSGYALKKNI